jgi:hypothetical protein
VAAARKKLKAEQPALKPSRLVFIDETAVTTKMTRLYGRAPLGERLVAKVCRTGRPARRQPRHADYRT